MLPRSAKRCLSDGPPGGRRGPLWGQSWAGRGRLRARSRTRRQARPGRHRHPPQGVRRVDPKADGPKPITTDKNGKWSILGLGRRHLGDPHPEAGLPGFRGADQASRSSRSAQPINITLKAPSQQQVQAGQAQQKDSPAALAKAALENANALLAQGKYAEARAAYEEGMSKLEDKTLYPAIYRAIADSYYKEGKTDQAIDTLKKSLELAPDDPDTLKLIVTLLASSNREAEAKTYMAKLPQGTQMDPAIGLNLGIKALQRGEDGRRPEGVQRGGRRQPEPGGRLLLPRHGLPGQAAERAGQGGPPRSSSSSIPTASSPRTPRISSRS